MLGSLVKILHFLAGPKAYQAIIAYSKAVASLFLLFALKIL